MSTPKSIQDALELLQELDAETTRTLFVFLNPNIHSIDLCMVLSWFLKHFRSHSFSLSLLLLLRWLYICI